MIISKPNCAITRINVRYVPSCYTTEEFSTLVLVRFTENTWLVLENITVWMEMVRLLVRNSWRCLQVSLQTSSLVVFNDSVNIDVTVIRHVWH